MGRPKSFDENVVLEKAMNAFWRNGFFDTSVERLEREMGINRFSIYSTFKSKDALFSRALKAYRANVLGGFLEILEDPESDGHSIRKFFSTLLSQYDPTIPNYGCLMVNTAAELSTHGHPACAEFEDYEKYLTGLFRQAAVRAIERNQIAESDNPKSLASYFFGLVLGMSVYAKCSPEVKALKSFVSHGLALLP